MAGYTLDTLDAVLTENLDQAAREGLDADTVADLLLRHRDRIACDGLATYADHEADVRSVSDLSPVEDTPDDEVITVELTPQELQAACLAVAQQRSTARARGGDTETVNMYTRVQNRLAEAAFTHVESGSTGGGA